MAETHEIAASYDEIVAGCGGIDPTDAADAMFITDQLGKRATAVAASREWNETLIARNEMLAEELAAKTVQPLKGHDSVAEADTGGTTGDALSEWQALVKTYMSENGVDKRKATLVLATRNPEAHERYLEEYNRQAAQRNQR